MGQQWFDIRRGVDYILKKIKVEVQSVKGTNQLWRNQLYEFEHMPQEFGLRALEIDIVQISLD